MQHTKITITPEEMAVITDTSFLITKSTVLKKMKLLLHQLQDKIGRTSNEAQLPGEIFEMHGKISSGENYKGLPFLILDYPRLFDKENIFAFRSMFWWGNYFLFTLHLQGKFLKMFLPAIISNIKKQPVKGLYISNGDDPWQHHIEKDNFIEYSSDISLNDGRSFLKIARKLELEKRQEIPDYGEETFKIYLNLLRTDEMS